MKSIIDKVRDKNIIDLLKLLYAKIFDRCFDLKYGIETSAHVHLENLDFNDEQKEQSYWYDTGLKKLMDWNYHLNYVR